MSTHPAQPSGTARQEEILPPQVSEKVREVGEADIVVGIPSYNNAHTISHVLRAVQAGLAKYFPRSRSLIVNSDGGSQDGTQQVVRELNTEEGELLLISHPMFPINLLTTPYHGLPGKGSAFRCIFRVAELLGARACAVVDSDLRSITPEWMQFISTVSFLARAFQWSVILLGLMLALYSLNPSLASDLLLRFFLYLPT